MKGTKVKIILVMVCIFLMITPIINAIDSEKITKQKPQKSSFGRIIEAHCKITYIPYINGSHGDLIIKYFVFGIGRHSIDIGYEDCIYWDEGKWNNMTHGSGDRIGFFHPIARKIIKSNTDGFGDFIFGTIKITLSVDGVVMDSDSCFFPIPY